MGRASRRAGRRMLAAALGLAALIAVAGPAAAAAARGGYRPTCRSGTTLFRAGAVRAFRVVFHDAAAGGEHQQLLACRAGTRRPLTLFDAGPYNAVQAERFRLMGTRLGFVVHDQGFANGSETDVGWADLRGGRVWLGLLNAGENAGPGDPLLPEAKVGYAIAADGAVAVIAGDVCQVVALLAVRAKSDRSTYRLGPAVVLYTAVHGGLDVNSIGLGADAVTWRTLAGVAGSAGRPPSPPGPPGTVDPAGGC